MIVTKHSKTGSVTGEKVVDSIWTFLMLKKFKKEKCKRTCNCFF